MTDQMITMMFDVMGKRMDLIENAGRETFNALKLVHDQQELMIETEKLLNMRIELLEQTVKELKGEE